MRESIFAPADGEFMTANCGCKSIVVWKGIKQQDPVIETYCSQHAFVGELWHAGKDEAAWRKLAALKALIANNNQDQVDDAMRELETQS